MISAMLTTTNSDEHAMLPCIQEALAILVARGLLAMGMGESDTVSIVSLTIRSNSVHSHGRYCDAAVLSFSLTRPTPRHPRQTLPPNPHRRLPCST